MEAVMRKQDDNLNPDLKDGIDPDTGEIVFEGNHYKTKAELCRAYGVKPATFAVRERRNYSLHDCVYGRSKKNKYEIDGKFYTLTELAEMSNELENTIYNRIRFGISPKDAIAEDYKVFRKTGLDNSLSVIFEYNGEKLTAKDISERTGLPMYTVHARHRAGWDIERIMTEPMRKIERTK